MKALFSISLLLSSIYSFSQDTIFLDKDLKAVPKNQAEHYRIINRGTKIADMVVTETFFLSGLKESETLTKYDPVNKTEDTISFRYTKTWHKNGKLKSLIYLRNGKFSDTLTTYWENGSLKRKDFFKEGKFITGSCYDSLRNEIKHFDYQIPPQYPGGDKKLLTTIGEKMEMPQFIRDNRLKIRVVVKFVVDENGNITNISMHEGYNKEVNDAAIKVISQLKRFKPSMTDGVPEKCNVMVPISLSAR